MTGDLLLVLGAALASGVEMVEATTIVLALGMSRGWRAPLTGTAAALGVLAVATAALGPALERIPIDSLRLVVGTLVLLFGLQWLRKAILRAADRLAEARRGGDVRGGARAGARDRAGERLRRLLVHARLQERPARGARGRVHRAHARREPGLDPARGAGAAAAAVIVVGVAAVFVPHPLSRVPENALKFGVGVMLTSFGTFWAAEGAGVDWPGEDAALLVLVVLTTAWSLAFVRVLRPRQPLPA